MIKAKQDKKIILVILAIVLVGIILASIVTRNIVLKEEMTEASRLAGANQNSELIANNIKKGITIGGITGTLEVLDTSDATAKAEDIANGKTAYARGEKIIGKGEPSVTDLATINDVVEENTKAKDSLGNKIIIPAGFKVINPTNNVEDGIIIEDVSAGNDETQGSQFVWVPVGKINTKNGIQHITLGRYQFDNDGIEIVGQVAGSCKYEIKIYDSTTYYQELVTTTSSTITKAKDIQDFINKVISSGGYYIGRYEAGDARAINTARKSTTSDSNPIVCKEGVYPYNYITQKQIANLCRNMYKSDNFTSDLINSFAWDTAIMFIQTCSGDKDYSIQGPLTIQGIMKCGQSTSGTIKDERCNIYDMAGNTCEISTEYCSEDSFVARGAYNYADLPNETNTRWNSNGNSQYDSGRPILYL